MSHVPLSAIVVNWNGLRYLPDCLDALLPQLPPGAEVLLVDNGSTDGSAALARERFAAIRLVALRENLGFAGGVNAGLRAARGELLLLLNNDAFAEPGFIDVLLGTLDRCPEVGAASAVLTFDHRPDLVASAGIRVRRDGLALDLWAGRPVAELLAEPQPIMGPSGGAALYRRALLEDIGLMEQGYFNYLEDADLAWRALLRGWRSVAVPGARARHVYSATAGQGSPFKQRLLGRNRVRTIVRCVPGPILRGCLPAILGYDLLAAAYGLVTHQPAMLTGRLAALAELPELLRQRRAIQARRRASIDEIARWLEPAGPPWSALREQRRLDAILAERVRI
ncbi:MAG TPA: glycosyltransferase family 2 protein [Roseiflexaceae bacterium]|nr:glycosyltransferase family 2 protein [Roseiflexaceae bacterium]